MRTKFINLIALVLIGLSMTSCATLFTKSEKEITFRGIPGTTVTDKDESRVITEIGSNGFASASLKKQLKGKNIEATKDGYFPKQYKLGTKIQGAFWWNIVLGGILGGGIDAATGKMKTYKDDVVDLTLTPLGRVQGQAQEQHVAVNTEPQQRVDRNNAGATDMERTILRWSIDSDPRGARIFYRVISNVPSEVKNTNETYLTSTPYEETRSFNINGLTYENALDVTIEFKVTKRGYEDQVKRFNVRQALDQQEINAFFELVQKNED